MFGGLESSVPTESVLALIGMEPLPSSVPRTIRGTISSPYGTLIPIFCANCGCAGSMITEGSKDFAFWLCNKCEKTYGQIAGAMCVPDEVFWAKMQSEQLEKYGRELTQRELIE